MEVVGLNERGVQQNLRKKPFFLVIYCYTTATVIIFKISNEIYLTKNLITSFFILGILCNQKLSNNRRAKYKNWEISHFDFAVCRESTLLFLDTFPQISDCPLKMPKTPSIFTDSTWTTRVFTFAENRYLEVLTRLLSFTVYQASYY